MFAAYSKESENKEIVNVERSDFLQNPSFESSLAPSTSQLEEISSDSSVESIESESDEIDDKKAVVLYNKKSVVLYKKPPSPKTQVFYFDNEPTKEYLKMDTIPARCLPKYRLSYRFSLFKKKFNPNSSKFKRYFKTKKRKKGNEGEEMDVSKAEEELRVYLSKNPNDIEKWLEFINYQVKFFF